MSAPPDPERRHPRQDVAGTLRLRVDLQAAIPAVWRRIEVASDLGLHDLHDVLQVVFGWEDRHLYRFTTGPEQDPGAEFACAADLRETWEDDPTSPTWNVRIGELLAEAGEQLYYQYDYGDNWWHVIDVEEVIAGRVPPGGAVLLEGEGAGPPEDCGGVHGYRVIVAASDRTHPDHDEAREELTSWWGVEIDPDDLGLVPFDPAAITEQLRRLDVPHRPPVPRRVGQKLTALLLRSRTTEAERQLRRLAASADAAIDIDPATVERMVHPLRVLFDAVGEGVKLTAAGYLPPRVVRTIFEELDLADEWIGAGNREDLTVPVLELRENAQRLGLLRKYKGRLVPTPRGRTLATDPVGLWRQLADRLPIAGGDVTDASWQASVSLLAVMTTGSTDRADAVITQLLTGLGWALEGGQPIDRRTVTELTAGDVRLLRRVGALQGDRLGEWPGQVTSGGIALARAALVDE